MFGKERAGKLHGEKLMLFVGRALGCERFGGAMVEADGVRPELSATASSFHEALASKIQTKLNATRMKTRRPIKLLPRLKIMPLDAITHAAKTAEERLPACANVAPDQSFRKGVGLRVIIF